MCHHYRLQSEAREIARQMQATLADPNSSLPFGDFYPLQKVAVVRLYRKGQREAVSMEWGLLPFWWKPSSRRTSLAAFQRKCFNARGETLAEKPTFREAFQKRRCLIPATEFFEKGHYFHLPLRRPFALAGLWDRWQGDQATIESCTIVTTTPNAEVAEVGHHRMPVVLLSEADQEAWLSGENPAELIHPVPDGTFLSTVSLQKPN